MTKRKSDSVRTNQNPDSGKSESASSDIIEELLKDTGGGWLISMPLRPIRTSRPSSEDPKEETRDEKGETK